MYLLYINKGINIVYYDKVLFFNFMVIRIENIKIVIIWSYSLKIDSFSYFMIFLSVKIILWKLFLLIDKL